MKSGSEFISRESFENRLNQHGFVVWFTGLSGSGKSTLANALQRRLFESGNYVVVLDGDHIRTGLNKNLSFTAEDRRENIRRISEVSRLFLEHGAIVIVATISPFQQDREMARSLIGTRDFVEVYVSTPLEVCMERDVKGLYKKASSGEISGFTGLTQPYETPRRPELIVNTSVTSVESSLDTILHFLLERNIH